jgi:hypothetical protein
MSRRQHDPEEHTIAPGAKGNRGAGCFVSNYRDEIAGSHKRYPVNRSGCDEWRDVRTALFSPGLSFASHRMSCGFHTTVIHLNHCENSFTTARTPRPLGRAMTPLPWVLASIGGPVGAPWLDERASRSAKKRSRRAHGAASRAGPKFVLNRCRPFLGLGVIFGRGDWQLHWKIKHNVQALRTARSAKATN